MKISFQGSYWVQRCLCFVILLLCSSSLVVAGESVIFSTDFEKSMLNAIPEDFLLLDGDFAVHQDGGNKFLKLPGAPLATFAILFGPNEKENISVSARIHGTNKGRRFPAFGVGLNGVAGYRLVVAPAKRSIELYRGDKVISSVGHQWKPDAWSRLKLEVRHSGDGFWTVRGKVWPDSEPEPKGWIISFEDTMEPYSGNASVWGKPFSGTPILYDDFQVIKLE